MKIYLSLFLSATTFSIGVYSLAVGIMNIQPALSYSIPQRVSLQEVNEHKGSISDFSRMYSERESEIDAVRTQSESRCLKDLKGESFKNGIELYAALGECVTVENQKHWAGISRGFRVRAALGTLVGMLMFSLSVLIAVSTTDYISKTVEKNTNKMRDRLLVSRMFESETSDQLEVIKQMIIEQSLNTNRKSVLIATVTTLLGAVLSYALSGFL